LFKKFKEPHIKNKQKKGEKREKKSRRKKGTKYTR
jgi:hypothetical protein